MGRNSTALQQTIVFFVKCTKDSLVRGTRSWDGDVIGHGILVEGRLRYGCCSHRGNSGVNVYSDGGLETFGATKGWVQLEVRCTDTTILKRGRSNRYCVKGTRGELCRKVAIVALWVLLDEMPEFVLMS